MAILAYTKKSRNFLVPLISPSGPFSVLDGIVHLKPLASILGAEKACGLLSEDPQESIAFQGDETDSPPLSTIIDANGKERPPGLEPDSTPSNTLVLKGSDSYGPG